MSLDSFETELLTELRAVIADRNSAPAKTARRARTGRIGLVAAAAAVVAAAAFIPAVMATPAFAVTDQPSGTIHVQVNRLEDADGLRAALEAHGVTADVTYLGFEMMCTPDRLDLSSLTEASYRSSTTVSLGQGGIDMTIDKRDIADGKAVVIAASKTRDRGVYAEVAIGAEGPIPPCEPIPLPPQFDDYEDGIVQHGKVIVEPTR